MDGYISYDVTPTIVIIAHFVGPVVTLTLLAPRLFVGQTLNKMKNEEINFNHFATSSKEIILLQDALNGIHVE